MAQSFKSECLPVPHSKLHGAAHLSSPADFVDSFAISVSASQP